MRLMYSIGIFFYSLGIRIAAITGNKKARLWVSGRKNLFARLQNSLSKDTRPVIWFHCASLGEFEQGRPLIEEIKSTYPDYKILLTFYSPSGYEVRKNYNVADFVCYMPADTHANAKQFLDIVNPKIVVFVKYEFWLNHLKELRKRNIPHYLVSAIFRPDQIFFKGHGGIFREGLRGYTHIFTQDDHSIKLLGELGLNNFSLAGDTRFDRVAQIASGAKDIEVAAEFSKGNNVIVVGSSWKTDEDVLFQLLLPHIQNGWKVIIAPHEISESRLHSIESSLSSVGIDHSQQLRFSKVKIPVRADVRVLIIDNIGTLSSLYRYGNVAYIGGGFGKSIHNTLEAAVYSIPVVFGPAYGKFHEALGLIACKGGTGVHSPEELQKTLDELLNDEEYRKSSGENAGNFVKENLGATQKILSVMQF